MALDAGLAGARFIDEANDSDEPFFVWFNTTAMHFRTHCAEKHKGKSGQGDYNDAMVAHDEHIGEMLSTFKRAATKGGILEPGVDRFNR